MTTEQSINEIKKQNCHGYKNMEMCQWAGEGFGRCEECCYHQAIQALQAQAETKCNPNDCPHPYGTYETCNECKANGDNVKAQADGEYISKSDMIDWLKDIRHKMKPQNYHTASEFEIAENQIWNLIQMLQMGALPTVAIPHDGEYVRKKDVMGCIGQTSLHFELARKLRKLQPVIIPSAEPKWILTSERLPRIGEWVLVTNGKCDGKYCEIMTYHGLKTQIVHRVGEGEYEEQYHEWTSGHGDILSENPLAWMPLPTPYEPQERSEE